MTSRIYWKVKRRSNAVLHRIGMRTFRKKENCRDWPSQVLVGPMIRRYSARMRASGSGTLHLKTKHNLRARASGWQRRLIRLVRRDFKTGKVTVIATFTGKQATELGILLSRNGR